MLAASLYPIEERPGDDYSEGAAEAGRRRPLDEDQFGKRIEPELT